jgi:hypothetical protein
MIKAEIKVSLPKRWSWLWFFRKKAYQINIPERWEEVRNPVKVLQVHTQTVSLSPVAFEIQLFKALTGLPSWVVHRIDPVLFAERLLPAIRFARTLEFKTLHHPVIKVNGQRWRIPAPVVKDMPLQQYFMLEQSLTETLGGTKDISWFLASLLRPDDSGTTDHLYQKGLLPTVTPYQVEQYQEALTGAPDEVVVYLLSYYSTQRQLLKDKYPALHEVDEKEKTDADIDWDSILPKIAEVGVFGPFDSVLSTPTVNYLAWANARREEHKPKQKTLQDIIRENHHRITQQN